MSVILELRQPLWLATPHGEGLALLLTDYGPESDHMWTCVQQEGEHTGELWTWHNSEVRVLANRSMLRGPPAPDIKLNIVTKPHVTSESEVDERADSTMRQIWSEFFEDISRSGHRSAHHDQLAFERIAGPLLRALVRPPPTL